MQTPINKVWSVIRKIKCKGTSEKYKHLELGDQIITDKKVISNTIGHTISKNSETKYLDFTSEKKECDNEPFTLDELLQSLNDSYDTAVGPDQIHYKILKHLPNKSKDCLQQLYNKIWELKILLCPRHRQ